MSKDTNDEEAPFDVQYQNAIFQFLFLLVEYYRVQMNPQDAVNKACDWLISLATEIKSKSLEISQEDLAKSKLFE